ncbi:MAG: DUF1838 domain-containing protein [Alphaproteobacteria bacterium]|nr:DUF1838 domain-containing protein [Alphaproteobacteria bacterium]
MNKTVICSPVTRRSFCLALSSAGLGACSPAILESASLRRTLDLGLDADALTAMVKMRGSLVAEDVPHWYYGTIYGVLPGEAPLPLVDFEGSEIDYYERQADGSYRAYGATVSFFRDTQTKKRIFTFDNPITGKRNAVEPNSISVKAHYIYSVNGMKRSDDLRPIPANGSITNHLNWREADDQIWLTMRRSYPAGLPMGEHQLVRGSLRELHNPNTSKVYTTAAPTYISPWLRWMDMRDHPGHTVWAGPAKKLDSIAQYPRELLTFMEKNYPEKLTAKPS